MQIAFALYDEFTMLDIVGPFQMLSAVPGTDCVWVAEQSGQVLDHTRTTAMVAKATFEEITTPDIVVVPGGVNTAAHFDGAVVEWLRAVHPQTSWTTSVCTGSLLMANAGLLDGLDATCHWASMDNLAAQGAVPSAERVIINHEARIATAAGVSAGIDMGLALIAELHDLQTAEMVQLALEYDPQPITDSGSIAKADPKLVEALQGFFTAS